MLHQKAERHPGPFSLGLVHAPLIQILSSLRVGNDTKLGVLALSCPANAKVENR